MTMDGADITTVGQARFMADTTVGIMVITTHGVGGIMATTATLATDGPIGDGEVTAMHTDGEATTIRTATRPTIITDITDIIITTVEAMRTMLAEGAHSDPPTNLAAMRCGAGPTWTALPPVTGPAIRVPM